MVRCGVLAKIYILSHAIILGSSVTPEYLYHVIMFGGPLGDALSLGILGSVYKAGCCRSSGLGKKQVSLRHKRTKATQQDLSNHILLSKTNGTSYDPHSSTLRIGNI